MKELILIFNEVEVQVKQTKDGLYSLNDLHRASGLVGKLNDLVRHLSEKAIRRFDVSRIKGGKYQGTYANEKGVYWFAAKVNEDFEDAVYEAFKLLVHGNTEKALDTAASFVVTPELVTQITKQSEAVNAAIAIWDTHNYPHRGPKAYTCIWSHIVAKCVTGGSLTSIKKAHGVNSLADYFIKTKHKEGIGAYLAITKILVPLLKSGVDYYVIKEALSYD